MTGIWTPAQIRVAEQRLFERVPEPAVMRRAAWAVASEAARLLRERCGGVAGRKVALLVGAGNNGGDALWAGAFLRRRGVGVTAVLLSPEKVHPAGLAALQKAGGRTREARSESANQQHSDVELQNSANGKEISLLLAGADLVIDGIVGIGGKAGLRPVAASLVEQVSAPILAVDLPSGLDAETGESAGQAVSATSTVTFGGLKPGLVLGQAAEHVGRVRTVDIGLSPFLPGPELRMLTDREIGQAWPIPMPGDDKYSQGVVGVAAGSAAFPGAAVLASGAAVRTTSGMVRYAGTAGEAVLARRAELVTSSSVAGAGRVQAWAVGPGISTDAAGREVLEQVLRAEVPVCADADAVTLLAQHPELIELRNPAIPLVLTPHAGEFARIAGPLGTDRVAAVRAAAQRLQATVLLKGNTTVIAEPAGSVFVNQAHGAWAATAGSGDVLTGMIGALLASGLQPAFACAAAARVHALAAHRAAHGDGASAGVPIGASDLLAALPEAIREVRARAK